jgi:isoleucyl-tRNA synthetase
MGTYRPVDPKADLPQMERDVLEFWGRARIFEKSLALREGAPEWVFYEGPPTANGKPGLHHVEARTFKDVFPRYKTMTGHYVYRKAGWDCHGLPVELEVEKEIGTKTKRDIEAFGVARFNELCRQSVTRYIDEFERVTERIGFWLKLDEAYFTMTPEYVQSVWWALKRLHEMGLLYQDDKVTAYCPRCGTPLSDHEVAMGYAQTEDPSIYVRLPVLTGPLAGEADLLIWTTMPWTLVPNTLAVVGEGIRYVLARGGRAGDRPVVVAAERLEASLGQGAEVIREVSLDELVGARYQAPFDLVGPGSPSDPDGDPASWRFVVVGDFVRTDEGTGVVHTGAAFGEDDMRVAREHNVPIVNPVDGEGRFDQRCGPYAGMYIREADQDIVEDLRRAGLLVWAGTHTHSYPFCWRCGTPLIYYARPAWYVRTTARKQQLLDANETVNWYPDYIKHGRYGDWLANNVDWSLSRERYWGTPLPIWICSNGHETAVGSLAELSRLAGKDLTDMDPHRPGIDDVTLPCPQCGEDTPRVPYLIDVWFDSGAMPFAQWGYLGPGTKGEEEFRRRFPADYIAEGLDQTRGWFYTLMAESVLLFGESSYRNVLCLGLLLGEDGRRMSKSLGNVIDPWDVIDRFGADAVRWFLLAGGSPWAPRRVHMEAIEEIVRQLLLTVWNTYAFFVTYANLDRPDLGDAPAPSERPLLDRWVLSQIQETVSTVREAMENYDPPGAGRRITQFVDDLSNWYVRRSRRRFWDPARASGDGQSVSGSGEGTQARDKLAAYATLHDCLATVAGLMAPFTPFITEELYRNLVAERDPDAPESVHLTDYPMPDPGLIDRALDEAMAVARQIVSLGRQVRTAAKVKVRLPLARAVVNVPGDPSRLQPLLSLVAEELNVKDVGFTESAEELSGWRVKPNFRVLGPRLGRQVQNVAAALERDDGTLASQLARGETVTVSPGEGEPVLLAPEDVELIQRTRSGWGVASDGAVTVAMDLEPDQELLREGRARELVRAVQDLRKSSGLEVSDRIVLGVQAPPEMAADLKTHIDFIAQEVLAVEVRWDSVDHPAGVADVDLDGSAVRVTVRRAA